MTVIEAQARDCATAGSAPAAEEEALPPAAGEPAGDPGHGTLRREGDVWAIELGERTVRVRDSKGMRLIARLLARPGVEIHAAELAAEVDATAGARGPAIQEAGVETRAAGDDDAGPLLDDAAKAAYHQRLKDLREELEEAESFNDPERASRARAEMEFIEHEVAGAVGLGGRDRKAASTAERARVRVTRAIRLATKRVAELDRSLGRELDATIRTGAFCVHEPDPRHPVTWSVDG
jgi:non-specific serine/threonine protein kinase